MATKKQRKFNNDMRQGKIYKGTIPEHHVEFENLDISKMNDTEYLASIRKAYEDKYIKK